MKINRFAYDAFMNMNLPKKFRAKVEDIKGKLMNPTEAGVPPAFLNARQILWMVLKEFKKPGGLLGAQGFRHLLCIKFAMCDGLADFQRSWDDCLANWPEKPTIKEVVTLDLAGIYSAQVTLDKGFNHHYTAYKTQIDASLVTADYFKLHDIVDRWLETQDNTRRYEAAERDMLKKTAAANGGGKPAHAFNVTPVQGKWQKGDCSVYWLTGQCKNKKCTWYHNDATKLTPEQRKAQKGKGKGGKKGGGKGKEGKKGKGKGKEGKKGKGKGKEGKKGKGKGKEERGRSTERNANGQPLRGRSPSGENNMTMCKFVKAGKCHNPDKCRYWHPGECIAWGKGKCYLGKDCVYMHTGKAGSAMPAQAQPKKPVSKAQKAADRAAKQATKAQKKADAAATAAQTAKKQGDR